MSITDDEFFFFFDNQGGLTEFSDSFASDGALSSPWIDPNGVWSVTSNKAFGTPTTSIVISGGNFTAWTEPGTPNDVPAGWTLANQDANNYVTQNPTGHMQMISDGSGPVNISQNITATLNRFLRAEIDVDAVVTNNIRWRHLNTTIPISNPGNLIDLSSTGLQYFNGWMSAASPTCQFIRNAAGTDVTIDRCNVTQFTESDCFATIETIVTHPSVGVDVTVAVGFEGNWAGVVACLDDPTNPQNYVFAAVDNKYGFIAGKCVNGVKTLLNLGGISYGAGGTVRIDRVAGTNTFQFYYNGTQYGGDITISDAGIVNNSYHGMFSLSNFHRLDNFFVGTL